MRDTGSRTERDAERAEARRAWINAVGGNARLDELEDQFDPRDALDEEDFDDDEG